MLQFLLDERISPVIARETVAKCSGMRIVAFRDWRAGSFMGASDRVILSNAKEDGLTLVSYDQKTIRPLLKEYAEQGIEHAGVVFVDTKTIAPQDFGTLVEALSQLWEEESRADWTSRVVFMRRPN